MNTLKAGTAIIDITPRKGLELGGYPHFPRYNTGVHDSLFASCLYLDNGTSQIVIVTLDILFFSKKHAAFIRNTIQNETGIPASNIMISCSHTHSGPWASGRLDYDSLMSGVTQDAQYVDELNHKIIEIIKEAHKNLFEAFLGFGSEHCGKEQGIGGNRRDPDGISDPNVYVLAVKDTTGEVRSVMVNYALHPTVMHEDSMVVSADYPCYIREKIKEKYPAAVMLFSQGTSGDQSSRYFRQGQSFDEAKRIGITIGTCATNAISGLVYHNEINMSAVSSSIPLKIRNLPSEVDMRQRVHRAKKDYENMLENNASYLEVQNSNLKLLGAEDLLGYITLMNEGKKIELLEDEQPAEVIVFTLGGLKLVGLPGEVFMEFGLEIKNGINSDLVIINEIANGCLPGYVCTKKAYEEGGYETDTSLLDAEFGYDLVRTAIELAKR